MSMNGPICLRLWLAIASTTIANAQDPVTPRGSTIRVATFNTSLNRNKAGQLQTDLSDGNNKQAKAIAEIIQRVRPQVILLNEFDYDPTGESVRLFERNYLKVSQNGQHPIGFKHSYAGPVNTGFPSGLDYDNNGKSNDPTDAFGFGRFPGQYGMVVLSKFPIETKSIESQPFVSRH